MAIWGTPGVGRKCAQPGDRLQFEGPGGSYRPSSDVDWHLYVGDESAFGAIGASLQALAKDTSALVFAAVVEPGCEINFPSAGSVATHWLYREESDHSENWIADAIAAVELPGGTFDVFVHGEAGEVRAVRQHLAVDRGVDLSDASISPYWRRRHTDEEWRKSKRLWMAGQA